VATPSGLRDFMNRSDFDSLYLDHYTVIVREWNLATILRTLMDEQMRVLDGNHEENEKKRPTPIV
jgi:diphthamide biosynthesis methyltransferase